MKSAKRILFLTLILLVTVGTLFAGGGGQSGASGGGKTITFYYWDENQKPGMDEVINAYTKATGVKVESTIIPYGQYWTRLQTSLPTVNGPDVFWLNYTHGLEYYPAGLVEPIDSYVARDKVDLSPFPTALKEMYSYNNKLYGLPKDYDTIGLYYNKALFDAKKVAYPTNNWTWEDMRKAAIALTDANTYGIISKPDHHSMIFPWILSNNGTAISADRKMFQMNNPLSVEAVQFLINLINVDKVSPTAKDLLELSADEYFQGGRAAMITSGSWMVPPYYDALGDKLGVARLPISKKPANVIHGLSFNISAKSANKEAAWGLVKAFSTKEAGEAQAKVVIPAYAGADLVWQKNWPKLDLKVFIDAASYADIIPTPWASSALQDDLIQSNIANMYQSNIRAADALATIDKECAAAANK